MKVLLEVREVSKIKGGHAGVAQRVTLDPCPDPGNATVDGYVGRQLQVVITNPSDFLPPTVEPGEIVSISIRVYDPDEGES